MIVATPTSPLAYAIGLALSEVIFTLPGIVLFTVLMALKTTIDLLGILEITASLVLLWYATSSIAFYTSTLFTYIRYTWAVVSY